MISVITSVYRTEKWIKTCINSILNQTYKDIELILVNDCSDDGCETIILSYNDPRIKYIKHSKNLGAGEARRTGIKNSSGEYTIFVDSDDYLELDCLEKMYNAAKETDADIICCLVNRYYKDHMVIDLMSTNYMGNKLIKRHLWDLTEYSPLRYMEDFNTFQRHIYNANKIVKLRYRGVNYIYRESSIMNATPKVLRRTYTCMAYIENAKYFKSKNNDLCEYYTYKTKNLYDWIKENSKDLSLPNMEDIEKFLSEEGIINVSSKNISKILKKHWAIISNLFYSKLIKYEEAS